jgi:hypothetical protein
LEPELSGAGIEGVVTVTAAAEAGDAAVGGGIFTGAVADAGSGGTVEAGVAAERPGERAKAELGARVSTEAVVDAVDTVDTRCLQDAGDSGEEGSTVWRFKAERSSSMARRDERGLLNCGADEGS